MIDISGLPADRAHGGASDALWNLHAGLRHAPATNAGLAATAWCGQPGSNGSSAVEGPDPYLSTGAFAVLDRHRPTPNGSGGWVCASRCAAGIAGGDWHACPEVALVRAVLLSTGHLQTVAAEVG